MTRRSSRPVTCKMSLASFAVLSIFLVVAQCAVAKKSDVAGLIALRDESRDRVIQLTDNVLSEYVLGRSRPYTVTIFFTAHQVVESNPAMRLEDLRMEYGLAAKALAAGPDADKIFFFEALLETSQKPFQMLQVNALPCVVRLPPNLAVSQSSPVELPKSDKMLPDTVSMRDYPWPAEIFLSFLAERHGLQAAPIERPSIYKSPLFPVLLLALALAAVYGAYKVYTLSLLRHPAVWATLALLVFWFSTSGGMYNIIRGVPFFVRDRNGNIQLFATGRQGQLGAEGFMMGTLYILVSCSLAFITVGAPRISWGFLRYGTSLVAAVVAAGSLMQTFVMWTSKTGYRHVFYM